MLKCLFSGFLLAAAAWSGSASDPGWGQGAANSAEAAMSAVLAQAVADQTPAAPGAGHGFLIDKHIAAGLTCDSCHSAGSFRPTPTTTCLRCHGGAYSRLAAMTAESNPNPHQSHQGEVTCASCHHIHAASENFCSQCHSDFDFRTP